jgi:anti-anti-sigma factor
MSTAFPTDSARGREVASIARVRDTLSIRVHGPLLGQVEAPLLAELAGAAISDPAAPPPARVVIDLSQVSAIASLGLGTCLEIRRRAAERGATTALAGLNRHLDTLFRTMRLDRLYIIDGDGHNHWNTRAA